jgi:hypothetical protein
MEFSSAISIEKYAILRFPAESSVTIDSLPASDERLQTKTAELGITYCPVCGADKQ